MLASREPSWSLNISLVGHHSPLREVTDDSLQKFGIHSVAALSPFSVSAGFGEEPVDALSEFKRNLQLMQRKRQEVSFCKTPQPLPTVQSRALESSRNVESSSAANHAKKPERSASFFTAPARSSSFTEALSHRDDGGSTTRSSMRLPTVSKRCSARTMDELASSVATDTARQLGHRMSASRLSAGGCGSEGEPTSRLLQRLPPRCLVDGRCVTPFFHFSSEDHATHITKFIESSCTKVDETFVSTHDQKKNLDTLDYNALGQNVMRTLRPTWQVTKKKYQTNGVMTYNYKLHIRNFWKFVIGRVLSTIHVTRMSLVKAARKGLAELRKAREAEAQKAAAQRRAKLAESLFSDLVSLRSNKKNAAQLTQSLYLSLKVRFLELAMEGTEVINLREFVGHARVDAALMRKLDRDQSGTLEFSEVLKATFPSMLQKDLQAMSRKWDMLYRESETQQESAWLLLSAESKAMASAMFRLCDADGKGVISKEDMIRHFVPPDWDPSEPMWFDQYFQTSSAVVSFEEFVEMIKFCFPPFRHGANASGLNKLETLKKDSVKTWRLPNDVIEAQEKATACDP